MCEMSWKEPFWNVFVYQHFPFDLLLGFHRGDSGQTLVLSSMAFATITNNCNFCCDFVLQPYKFFWLKNSKSNKNLIIFSGFLCIHFQILNADSAFEVEVPDGWTDGRRTYSKTMPLKWYINFPESGCTYIHTAPASRIMEHPFLFVLDSFCLSKMQLIARKTEVNWRFMSHWFTTLATEILQSTDSTVATTVAAATSILHFNPWESSCTYYSHVQWANCNPVILEIVPKGPCVRWSMH